jgi:hypothetical protein
MTGKAADRFAAVSLDLYGAESSFEITLSNSEECDTTAESYRKLGCTVEIQSFKNSLTVKPPQGHTEK